MKDKDTLEVESKRVNPKYIFSLFKGVVFILAGVTIVLLASLLRSDIIIACSLFPAIQFVRIASLFMINPVESKFIYKYKNIENDNR